MPSWEDRPGRKPEDFCPPCGVCRQVMMEFCDPERFRIVLGKGDLSFREYTLKELLPWALPETA